MLRLLPELTLSITARQVTVTAGARVFVSALSASEWNTLTDTTHFNRQQSLVPIERICREIEKEFPGRRRISIALSHQIAPIWQLEAPPLFLNWAETQGWAHEALRQKIGPMADQWNVRAEWSADSSSVMASTIHAEWLDTLLGVFKRNQMQVHRVQPWITHFCANQKKSLKKTDTWLALVEAGRICLVRVKNGDLQRIRVESFADSALSALSQMLQRATLSDSGVQPKNLVIQAPGIEADWHLLKPWQITLISPQSGQSPDQKHSVRP